MRTTRLSTSQATPNGLVAMVRITIEDSGRGVPHDHLAKVFDPFFTTKEVGSGTGLGLSLALGVVQQHGGQIRFESSEGSGTAVTIDLPVESGELRLEPTLPPPVTSRRKLGS